MSHYLSSLPASGQHTSSYAELVRGRRFFWWEGREWGFSMGLPWDLTGVGTHLPPLLRILQSHPGPLGQAPAQPSGVGSPSWVLPATLCPVTSCPPPPVSPQQRQLGLETVGVVTHLELGKVPRGVLIDDAVSLPVLLTLPCPESLQ